MPRWHKKRRTPVSRFEEGTPMPGIHAKTRVRHYRRTCLKRNGYRVKIGVFPRTHRLKICNLQVFSFSGRLFLRVICSFRLLRIRYSKQYTPRAWHLQTDASIFRWFLMWRRLQTDTDIHRHTRTDTEQYRRPHQLAIAASGKWSRRRQRAVKWSASA